MIENRSVPTASVIPELAYRDVAEASTWLCNAFGFTERLRIGTHRVQLVFGNGAMVVTELGDNDAPNADRATHSMLVRVEDAQQHHDRAAAAGAKTLDSLRDYPTIEDPSKKRPTGVEPVIRAWKALVLPLHHGRAVPAQRTARSRDLTSPGTARS